MANSFQRLAFFLSLGIGLAAIPALSAADEKKTAARQEVRPVLEVTSDLTLDPKLTYGAIVVKKSGVVIDGKGAWLIGAKEGLPKNFQGNAISAVGVSGVTIKNIRAKGFETGLLVRDGQGWTVENCDFSDNFHDPDFGWGESGRRGGVVLERVHKSTFRKNKANRVWDACVLVDSDDNLIEDNDFSRTSNTCLKLWTASRNTIRGNNLSYGIRIKPQEVHARDSTGVLFESGSNDNRMINNDCTYGGDGIFVRVLNGWCSTGNYFEGNDCSYANNNGFECWAPRNYFVKNKANHCSYGFWLGGSDQSELIDNEASFNGLAQGNHNSPHLPGKAHAGIVYMFGPSTHTLARGNVCKGNNGAGIAIVGDLDSKGKKWKAYHWVLEQNRLEENRWGLYVKHADWIVGSANEYRANTVKDVFLDGDVSRFSDTAGTKPAKVAAPRARLDGPQSVMVGTQATWDAAPSTDPEKRPLSYVWSVDQGDPIAGAKLSHTFTKPGFHRIGLNVSNGLWTQPAWRNVYVVREVQELGTEGDAAGWTIEDFQDRARSAQQTSRAKFSTDASDALLGKSALQVVIEPYAGFRAALTYPQTRDAKWSMKGKTKLSFWLKAINADAAGWQGGPFLTLHGEGEKRCFLEPKKGLDLMREVEHNEGRDGWRYFEIPLSGNARWQRDGDLPETVQAISLAFDSWGAPTLRLWLDGLAFE